MRQLITFILLLFTLSLYSQDNEMIIQLNDSIFLKLIRVDFDSTGRQIIFWENSNDAIRSIDGNLVYGTDATLPKYELKSAILIIGQTQIKLETEGMYDPWNDNEEGIVRFEISKYLDNPYRLRGHFSVGVGLYYVEWSILDNTAFRTILTHDWTIINEDKFLKK